MSLWRRHGKCDDQRAMSEDSVLVMAVCLYLYGLLSRKHLMSLRRPRACWGSHCPHALYRSMVWLIFQHATILPNIILWRDNIKIEKLASSILHYNSRYWRHVFQQPRSSSSALVVPLSPRNPRHVPLHLTARLRRTRRTNIHRCLTSLPLAIRHSRRIIHHARRPLAIQRATRRPLQEYSRRPPRRIAAKIHLLSTKRTRHTIHIQIPIRNVYLFPHRKHLYLVLFQQTEMEIRLS